MPINGPDPWHLHHTPPTLSSDIQHHTPHSLTSHFLSVRGTAVAYVLGLVHARRRHSHVGGSEIVRAPGPCAARTEAPRGATACRPARQLGLGGRGQAAQADREDRRREQRTQQWAEWL